MQDISDYLSEWPYEKDNNVRIIEAEDGRELLQIRHKFGFQQMEADGRPDGKKPHGKDSLLEYYLEKLDEHKNKYGIDIGFMLDSGACDELREECNMMNYRAGHLLGIDFKRVERDSEHNIRIFDLVHYAEEPSERIFYEEYRPYVIKLNREAKLQAYIQKKQYDKALEIAEEALKTLNELHPVYLQMPDQIIIHPQFLRNVHMGKSLFQKRIEEINHLKKSDVPAIEKIRKRLQQAIDKEQYEEAAELRDQIRNMNAGNN